MDQKYISRYKDIKDLIKKINNKMNFDQMDYDSLFENYFDNAKKSTFIRFNPSYIGTCFAVELFNTGRGYNYLNDCMNLPFELQRMEECDSITAAIIPSSLITIDDGNYIHSLKSKIMREGNLVIYKYNYGSKREYASLKDLNLLYKHLEFLLSICTEDKEFILDTFSERKTIISDVDSKAYTYYHTVIGRRNLSWMPKYLPENHEFVKEYISYPYEDEVAYMFASYYPIVVEETKVKPLFISFIVPNKFMVFKYISTPIDTYKDYIFGILDQIFESLGYLPVKIVFDNRDINQLLSKTLDLLNIEHELALGAPCITTLPLLLGGEDEKGTGFPKDDSSLVQPKDAVDLFMTTIISAVEAIDINKLNQMVDDEYLDDDELEELEENEDSNDTDLIA